MMKPPILTLIKVNGLICVLDVARGIVADFYLLSSAENALDKLESGEVNPTSLIWRKLKLGEEVVWTP